jgi:hypothetical protein
MMIYSDYLARIRQHIEALALPPLSLLPQMLACHRQAQNNLLQQYQAEQNTQVKRAHAAKVRMLARHQAINETPSDYRTVIQQHGGK